MYSKARNYKKLAAVAVLPLLLLVTSCIATRKFVRNNQAPLETRVASVDQKTTQNAQAIKELSEKTEAGVAQAQNTADQGVQAAKQADAHAQAANQTAESGLSAANQARSMFNNLQDHQAAHHTVITFGFNQSDLTKGNQQALDEVAQALGPLKLYLIQVVGHTDGIGSKHYNLALSQRRADSVVRYLTHNHGIPVVQIHTVGYGEDVPVASNKTGQGRGENRRVEITVLVPQLEKGAAQTSQTSTSGN